MFEHVAKIGRWAKVFAPYRRCSINNGLQIVYNNHLFQFGGQLLLYNMCILLFLYRLNMSFETMVASFIAVLLFIWIDDYRKKKKAGDKWKLLPVPLVVQSPFGWTDNWLFKNEVQPDYPLLGGVFECYT